MSITIHRFGSTGEAYDRSQCDDAIRDGDVLLVPSERAVAVMVSAWPTAPSDDVKGSAFHVCSPTVDPSSVLHTDGSHRDYSAAFETAREIAATFPPIATSMGEIAEDGESLMAEYESDELADEFTEACHQVVRESVNDDGFTTAALHRVDLAVQAIRRYEAGQ